MTETVGTDESAESANMTRAAGEDGPVLRERAYAWSDPLELATFGAGLSGMELFAAMVEGRVPPPPIMQTLDFSSFSYEEGRVAVGLTPQEFHYNPLGSVHGGVFAALLDTVCEIGRAHV